MICSICKREISWWGSFSHWKGKALLLGKHSTVAPAKLKNIDGLCKQTWVHISSYCIFILLCILFLRKKFENTVKIILKA